MTAKTGRFAILEQLLADGITYMFGNPGTVEQGFLDALGEYPEMRYVTTLQETIAVAMADGYARATQRPTLVQLHSGVGLGNGIGMMYQAKRGGAPLVVIAGESGVRYDSMDAQMAADLVSMARPVTKWSTRVIDPSSTLRVLRQGDQDRRDAADAGRCSWRCRWTCSTPSSRRRSCRRPSPTRAWRRPPRRSRRGGRDARRRLAADRRSSATASPSRARRPS